MNNPNLPSFILSKYVKNIPCLCFQYICEKLYNKTSNFTANHKIQVSSSDKSIKNFKNSNLIYAPIHKINIISNKTICITGLTLQVLSYNYVQRKHTKNRQLMIFLKQNKSFFLHKLRSHVYLVHI